MKINEALDEANLILKKNLIKSAKLDSEILMAEVIQKDRKYIILNLGENLKPKIYKNFQYFRQSLILELFWENSIEYNIKDKSVGNFEKISRLSLARKFFSKLLRNLIR